MMLNRHLLANYQTLTPQLLVSLALTLHSMSAAAEPVAKAQASAKAELKPSTPTQANSPATSGAQSAAKAPAASAAIAAPASSAPILAAPAAANAAPAAEVKGAAIGAGTKAEVIKDTGKKAGAAKAKAEAAAPLPAITPNPAQVELDAAKEAYTGGNYALASEHYAKARELADSADAMYFHSMSLDLQGKTSNAYALLSQLVNGPRFAELSAEQQAQGKQRLEALGKIPANLVLHVAPANAALSVDGAPQIGSQPFSLMLPSGKHELVVTAPGFESQTSAFQAQPAENTEQNVELKALAPQKAAPEQAKPVEAPPAAVERNPVPAYVTIGVAGASAIVGGIFGVLALNSKKDFNHNPTTTNADRAERNALIADMAFGVALTLGITGVVLLTTDEPTDLARSASPSHVSLSIAPVITPKMGGAFAQLKF